jgi:DNA-binding MarR family transcriptional regulator
MFEVNKSLGYLLAMTAKKTSARFSQLMKEHDIPFGLSEWVVLSRLWEEDGLNQQQISESSNVAKPNISNYCDQLEKNNLIVRVPDPTDRRNHKLFLTNKGKTYKNICQQLAVQANNETLEKLSQEESRLFFELLMKINE